MRQIVFLFLFSAIAYAQSSPIRLGDAINLIPPATSANGNAIAFAAAVAPDSTVQKGTNLYLYTQGPLTTSVRQLTRYAGDSNLTGVTSLACNSMGDSIAYTALAANPGGPEEVHLINTATGADRSLVTDKQGCIQPLCPNCFRSCVGPLHLNSDASKVLYSVARQQPFFVVNADGSNLTQLPVYSGVVAPSAQRVISRSGQLVFTSSAPFGPTFAAAATDLYTMNLDGSNRKQVTQFGNPNFYASNATISADGSLIAFESNFSDQGPQLANQIWIVRPDGTGLRQISTGPDGASIPSISGDGSVVTYVQSGQIKSARTSCDGTILTLTNLSISLPRDPVVSDDGLQVAFTLGPQFGSPAAVYRIPTGSPTDMRTFVGVYIPRLLNNNGVASAAGYGAPSPGSLISVYGAGLGLDELTQAGGLPLPTSLNGLSLLVNGAPAPLLAVTPWQINAQLPQTIAPGAATFQVRYASGTTTLPVSAEVKVTSPANFVFPFTQNRLFYTQAAAFHAGTAVAADMDHPAAAGETLEIYGLGLGITDPVVDAGVASPNSPPARARQTPRVQIGGQDATVKFAGLTPGLVGVYQVNAMVPTGLKPGLATLAWMGSDGGVIYSNIAVK